MTKLRLNVMNSERETTESSRVESSDYETDTYYYRARYYDPSVGRFTREDPQKEVIRGLNFYAYVRNSSPNLTDPDGRDPCGWLC
ncbi:MAG TPA: RHS repeat-associated core domain-containing protein [Candidatus Acidoferrum sp.]